MALIRVTYRSIDRCREARTYKTLAGARKYAHYWIGPHPEIGYGYAVSGDGIGKITVEGATLADLFPSKAEARAEVEPDDFRYIPKGATKVAAKRCDAVAYIYERVGILYGMVFLGKQAKPLWHYRFKTEAKREAAIKEAFINHEAHEKAVAERAAALKAAGPGLEVGDVVSASWGYDQTNVDFYQVVEVKRKQVVVRKIGATTDDYNGKSYQGRCRPVVDNFIGEPLTRVARDGRVKIDDVRHANKTDPTKSHYFSDGH